MVEVEVSDNTLNVRVKGLHKLWAFRSGVDVPLAHVTGASLYRHAGLISAGLFRRRGEFWDVADRSKAVVIELSGERFSRLVLEVADPNLTVESLRRVLRSR